MATLWKDIWKRERIWRELQQYWATLYRRGWSGEGGRGKGEGRLTWIKAYYIFKMCRRNYTTYFISKLGKRIWQKSKVSMELKKINKQSIWKGLINKLQFINFKMGQLHIIVDLVVWNSIYIRPWDTGSKTQRGGGGGGEERRRSLLHKERIYYALKCNRTLYRIQFI